MSTALYRRYRPERFADVIGQEHVTDPLRQALRSGRVNHAYLFSGPRGCGKTTSARILARCLNCEQGPTDEPCGECDSCVALARGGAGTVDVIEIDAASHGGVDDARDLREKASFGPAQSRYKVYIIDEAHMVTPQGFNALLKIVEEPPDHVKFVFATTEPEKVIGTIRSRTHHYPFRLVPPARLTEYLEQLCVSEGVKAEPGVMSFVVRAGGGSVRDSLSVLDQLIAGSTDEGLTYAGAAALLGFTDGELLDATIDAFAAGDAGGVFRQIDRVIETGLDPRRFVEDLLERLRDLIVVQAAPDHASAILRGRPEDQVERLRVQASAFGAASLSRAADVVNAGLTEMTGATSPRLQLELIAARVLLPGASGEEGYGSRLDRIERRLEVGGATPQPAPVPAQVPPHQPDRTPDQVPDPPRTDPRRPAPQAVRDPEPVRDGWDEEPAESPAAGVSGAVEAAHEGTPGPVQEHPRVPEPGTPAAPGGVDVAAIRRAWPQVLERVARARRVTWALVSDHAQVVAYDGDVVTLGFTAAPLAQTFRGGNHRDIVQQALLDEIGVGARVEGVPHDGSVPRPSPAPPQAPAAPSAAPGPSATSGPSATPGPSAPGGESAGPRDAAGRSDLAGRASGSTSPEPAATWGDAPGSGAPAWASGDAPPARPDRPAASGPTTATGPPPAAAPVPPDDEPDEPSPDDEDVEDDSARHGQALVERMLGATVIPETSGPGA